MELPEVLGLPPMDSDALPGCKAPECHRDVEFTKCVFPRMRIYPCEQSFSAGLEFFALKNDLGWAKYIDFLRINGGYEPNRNWKKYIDIAYQNTSGFTETYSNDFGQSSLVTMTTPLSQGAQEFMWVAGTNIADTINKKRQSGDKTMKMVDNMLGAVGDAAESAGMSKTRRQQLGKLAGSLVTGGKLNFPMIWKSTSFDRSYDITIRLYNLCPGNDDSNKKMIIGPMVALLPFVVPASEDGNTYKWPLIAKFDAPGQFRIEAGYIKTISVIKGGDSNDLAWNNRSGMIDLKISIGDLYSTMISSETVPKSSHAPTVKKMTVSMEGQHATTCCKMGEDRVLRTNSAIPRVLIDKEWSEEQTQSKIIADELK